MSFYINGNSSSSRKMNSNVIIIIYHRLLMLVDVHNIKPDRHHFHYQQSLISPRVQSKPEVVSIDHSSEPSRERHHNFAGSIGFRAPLGTCSERLAVLLVDETEQKPDNAREADRKSRQKEKNGLKENKRTSELRSISKYSIEIQKMQHNGIIYKCSLIIT